MVIGSDVRKPHARTADTAKIEDAASNRYALIDDDLTLRHWRKDSPFDMVRPETVHDDSLCPWASKYSMGFLIKVSIMYCWNSRTQPKDCNKSPRSITRTHHYRRHTTATSQPATRPPATRATCGLHSAPLPRKSREGLWCSGQC